MAHRDLFDRIDKVDLIWYDDDDYYERYTKRDDTAIVKKLRQGYPIQKLYISIYIPENLLLQNAWKREYVFVGLFDDFESDQFFDYHLLDKPVNVPLHWSSVSNQE
ncbi:hypothetical protein L596_009842 [Steinernema carpocapsae]|uniref:Uncharacterized protein n=1 Tax=Steinernema carpocapsae TaxID=34508 RepID=A0A4U5PGI8_STECR|nr:hypothetical protein L596_009842 [Steinernema carpocapsae]